MLKLSALRMVGSNLFHSMIADGKKVFLKKLCLILTIGIAYEAYEDVVYKNVFSGINLKDWKDFLSYEFCKTLVIFYTTYHHGDWSDSKPSSCQILYLEYLALHQLLSNMIYTYWILVFGEREN